MGWDCGAAALLLTAGNEEAACWELPPRPRWSSIGASYHFVIRANRAPGQELWHGRTHMSALGAEVRTDQRPTSAFRSNRGPMRPQAPRSLSHSDKAAATGTRSPHRR